MPYHLLTVERVERSPVGVRVLPRILLRRLPDRRPDSTVVIRLPDGTVRGRFAPMFCVATGSDGDGYAIATDPVNPELSLTIAGLDAAEVPAGTEVWLS
jgi:hypothetical protein